MNNAQKLETYRGYDLFAWTRGKRVMIQGPDGARHGLHDSTDGLAKVKSFIDEKIATGVLVDHS